TAEWRLGNTAEGEEFSRRALQTAREAEDPLLEARCLILMAHISSGIGDLEHARDLFQEALGILEEEGDVTELPRILNGQGDVCKIQGHYGMAMLQYEKCIASAKELGNYRYQARGLINSAECMAKEGSLQEARKRMEGAHDLLAGKGNLYSMASIEFVWGIIAFKEGNQEVMDGHFTSAINKMEELETPYELGLFAYEYAQALRETGRKEEAKIMYMKAGEAFERTGASELLMKTKKAAAEMAS
ncbi:MAG: tetratricopeptide repeat protein, partial [Thermoplasmata archaeon]|nr:tetratricopeptide repeat protein [Thermoplasmata archaeon]